MDNNGLIKNGKTFSSINKMLNFSFVNSITLKIIIVITVTFLFNASIAKAINSFINSFMEIDGEIGLYINTMVNVIVVNLII